MSAPCPNCKQNPCECRWPALRVPGACNDCGRVSCRCGRRRPTPPLRRMGAVPVCPRCHRVQCICYSPRPPRAVNLVITRRQHALVTVVLGVLCAAAAMLLTACGDGPHGTVSEKEHKPGHWSVKRVPDTRQSCHSIVKRGVGRSAKPKLSTSCRTITVGTKKVRIWHPECWQIELDQDAHELCIPHDKWRSVDVGDKW